MKKQNSIKKMILAGFFLALSYIMPFLTGQISEIGSMLCPLHIPVLLCGFFCGWSWGLLIGFVAPLFRSFTLGMPPLFPKALCMAFELAVYGAVSGLMYNIFPKKKIYIYCSLIIAMISGRIIWGIIMYLFTVFVGNSFTFSAFITTAFVNAMPGIVVQVVLIPVLVMIFDKQKN